MVNMIPCIKRRLLYAASQSYQPGMFVSGREVRWLEPPMVVRRGLSATKRVIDVAIAGRTEEGVVVAFRGSLPPFFGDECQGSDGWAVLLDWMNGAAAVQVERQHYPGGVHLALAVSMDRLWDDLPGAAGVHSMIQTLLERGRRDGLSQDHIFLTGHGKGGALANLCAVRAAAAAEWRRVPVSVATFGAPRAGDARFARAYQASRVACLRYESAADLVPQLPCGPETGFRVQAVAAALGIGTAGAWQAVGQRVGGTGGHQPWAGSRRRLLPALLGRRGMGVRLEALLPDVLNGHAICPGSPYDRLVCTGEPACDHGIAAPVPTWLPLRRVA